MYNNEAEFSVDTATANRNYKDSVFRFIFKEKKELLALYNAVNGTHYENPDDLQVTTLDNAIYLSIKNDISCVVEMRLDMYEHQSSVNPNIPLRDLHYVSRTYSALCRNEDIYTPKLIKLPNPKFIVFYNGTAKQPAIREMRLSDAFFHREENPSLELVVTQININPGYNDDLLDKCKSLKEYTMYVSLVREYLKSLELKDAIEKAVNECIRDGILADFLKKNKAEVISMCLFEYDEELHRKSMNEYYREEGLRQGREEGIKQGIQEGIQEGIQKGIQEGIQGTVTTLRSIGWTDEAITDKLVEVYKITTAEAKELVKSTA